MPHISMEHVIVIGGGPAGLSAALYLARAQLNPLVFAGSPPGGQLTLTTEVDNYPGAPGLMGPELVQKIRNQAESFGARIIDENVSKLIPAKSILTIQTESGEEYGSRSLLMATGAQALWLDIPNEARLRGRGVSACATCDGFFFRKKTVVVVGGGDTAIEEATHLTKYAEKVYLIHRRGELRASKIMQKRLFENPKVEVILNARVLEVLGDKKVESIKIMRTINETEVVDQIVTDGFFVAIGHRPDTDLISDVCIRDEKGYILTAQAVAQTMLIHAKHKDSFDDFTKKNAIFSQTSHERIFAAGDCVDKWYRQAIVASAMGVSAALDIERFLSQG